jgi:predicted CXXCH cytochrome family protein
VTRYTLSNHWMTSAVIGLALTPYAWLAAFPPQEDPAQKSRVSFPLSLFEQATSEDYIGSEACKDCHASTLESWPHSAHAVYMENPKLPVGKRGCEGCHGPGKFHLREENDVVIAFPKLTASQAASVCLRCHTDTMTPSLYHKTAHGRAEVSCMACHQIHPGSYAEGDVKEGRSLDRLHSKAFPAAVPGKPLMRGDEATYCGQCHRSEVAQFRNNFHHPIPEGRMVCSDCHEVHPTKNEAKKTGIDKGSCTSCHADKAGPFVYEHSMVVPGGKETCGECHRPHGSSNPALLNSFSRGLCAQCHTDKAVNHRPGRTCWSAGCHGAVHGSNSDPRLIRP